jgi:hypothetical protein
MSDYNYNGINQSFQGFYKVKVVNPKTDEVTWESEWSKNLILNQGMDALYSQIISDITLYGICGTGTRPNSISGETSEITQSGATVYLNLRTGLADFTSSNGTYAATVQVGDMLKYSDNSESRVTAVTDGFNLAVTPSYTFTTGKTFAVWKTSQVGLETETKRSNDYVTGTDNCSTTSNINERTWKRTYDFSTEVSNASYNEVGVGWEAAGATKVFSRILLGSPIAINTGFKLRLVYDLVGTFTPSASIFPTASIGGWPVAPSTNTIGSESLQNFLTSTVNSSGVTDNTTAFLDPSFTSAAGPIYLSVFVSPSSASLSSFNTGSDRSLNAGWTITEMSKASYVASSFYVDKTGVLPVGTGNATNISSVGIGKLFGSSTPAQAANNVCVFNFNQTQSKNSSQTLSITYRSSWTRILA